MRTFILVSVASAVAFFAVLNVSAMDQLYLVQNPLIGKPAPEFVLVTADDRQVSLTEFRQGRNAVIFFWATWCPHCREALHELSREVDAFNQKNVALILVNLGEDKDIVKDYARRHDLKSEIFLDEDSQAAEDYRVVGIPLFIFIDKQGTVRGAENFLTKDFERFFANAIP